MQKNKEKHYVNAHIENKYSWFKKLIFDAWQGEATCEWWENWEEKQWSELFTFLWDFFPGGWWIHESSILDLITDLLIFIERECTT